MKEQDKLIKLDNEIKDLMDKLDNSDSDFQAWRTDVEICLSKLYGSDSIQLKNFKNRLFSPQAMFIGAGNEKEIKHRYYVRDLETTKKEFDRYIVDFDEQQEEYTIGEMVTNKVFLIHGHDETLKTKVARLLEQQNVEIIILNEKPNHGKTIIEKIEAYNDVDIAIALFTKDDFGNENGKPPLNARARQNVVFEAGYFIGLLQRKNVVIIAEEGIEMPSDLSGVVYVSKDNWEIDVLRELKEAGLDVDLNKLI